MDSLHTVFNEAFVQEFLLKALEGAFELLNTFVLCAFAWLVYSRHLRKKQLTRTAYLALKEIQQRQELEALYCKEIQPDSPSRAKSRVRRLAVNQGVLLNSSFTPKAVSQKIASYERRLGEELPTIVS
ncbi:hypothetical protein [Vibrio harveyi]|uniref:hypothetical protein n=1 Tax=Vibrio harveyi TaxID=669 RepID=UPI002480B3A6|nr:hypothetical protein [Vibrio harveyi]